MEAAVVATPQAAPRSRKAVVALALAIVTFLVGWFPLVWITVLPAAVVVGVLALRDVRHGRAVRGRRMAWSAIALAAATPFLWFALYILALGAGNGGYFG